MCICAEERRLDKTDIDLRVKMPEADKQVEEKTVPTSKPTSYVKEVGIQYDLYVFPAITHT